MSIFFLSHFTTSSILMRYLHTSKSQKTLISFQILFLLANKKLLINNVVQVNSAMHFSQKIRCSTVQYSFPTSQLHLQHLKVALQHFKQKVFGPELRNDPSKMNSHTQHLARTNFILKAVLSTTRQLFSFTFICLKLKHGKILF